MYKTLTEFHHIWKNNLLPSEQTGCHSGSKGCKDQLLQQLLLLLSKDHHQLLAGVEVAQQLLVQLIEMCSLFQ
jgi:hypothetical protein